MELKILLFVVLALLGETCSTEITIELPKQSTFAAQLVNAVVHVLASCYGGQANAVGIYGDQTGILFGALLSKQALPVISIDNTTEVAQVSISRHKSRFKLQLFTIVARSTTQLQEILKKIKNSPWWNHMAAILIVNWVNESDDDCANAFEFLWAAWQMNLLNVNFFCVYRKNKVLLYTYNPYTNKAPNPWKVEKTFKGHFDHPWSMFARDYQENEGICEGLFFDKTVDLGGYPISASVRDVETFWHSNLNKTGIDSFEGLDGLVAQIFFRAMNANINLTIYGEDSDFINWNEKGETIGFILDIIKGTSDIVPLAYYQESLMNQTITYPHWNSGVGVVTQYSGSLSQLSKINSVLDISSRYGLYLVILKTILFFKFFVRQRLTPAILNTLRIICNCGLAKVPDMTASRIYLGTLFFFQITILALYQGQLASLLTKEVYLKNVNTMQDLADSGHKVHVFNATARILTDPALSGRIVGHPEFGCLEYVLRDSSAACVEDWDALISQELPLNLHLSDDIIVKMANVYAIRDDWPPEQRLNNILAAMIESDVLRRTYTEDSQKVLRINKFNEYMRNNQGPKVMTLHQLSFAFAILAFGMVCATITFIIEIIVA